MPDFRWALLGPGRIARRFAHALRELPDTRLAVVVSRDEQRAADFARGWCEPGDARMNFPGKPSGNWTWRLKPGALLNELARRLLELNRSFARI